VIPADVKSIFGWIELIVMNNLPFNVCENVYYRKGFIYEGKDKNTIMHYMHNLGGVEVKKLRIH
jgi:hypothetical protein